MYLYEAHTYMLPIFDPFFDYKFLFVKYEPSNKPHTTTALW